MQFFIHVFIVCCVRLFSCLGYNLVLGKTKILNFGYVGYLLPVFYGLWVPIVVFDLHPLIGLANGVFMAVLFAWVFARLSDRMVEDAFGVMSIAVHLILLTVVLNWQPVTRGALGIPKIPRLFLPEDLTGFAIAIGLAALFWALFVWWVDRGPLGRQMEAFSEHHWHAESLGISKKKLFLQVYLVTGIGVLLQALFYSSYLRLVTPQDFTFPTLILYVTIIVAGGPGKFWGVFYATFALTFLGEGLRFIDLPLDLVGPLRLLLFGLILFVAVWLRRDTLFPKPRSI